LMIAEIDIKCYYQLNNNNINSRKHEIKIDIQNPFND